MASRDTKNPFVDWFRSSTPYINAFRGRTFVITFGGEVIADKGFANLVQDLVLLNSLGIKLVLVHGSRPQIEARLKKQGSKMEYVNGLRVTDGKALECVKEAAGAVRVEIEALMSMGLPNTPMAGSRIRIASGNFVTARPLGIHDGVDYQHTGEVRRIDTVAIEKHLKENSMVLLSPIGYSPTGEVFNLYAEDVATSAAVQLAADKIIHLVEAKGIFDARKKLIRQLNIDEAEKLFSSRRKLPENISRHLLSAIHACRHGVRRAHIIDRHVDGAILQELFTRDGIGTLITDEHYDDIRKADIEDVGGILELISPLEQEGTLVRRSREMLEMEIERFTVAERDGMIVGCAALYPFHDEKIGEIACLAIHPDYRSEGKGSQLLQQLVKTGKDAGLEKLFVLTTRTSHWFQENGFKKADIKVLPVKRRLLYNYQRNSKVFIKKL
ncbi:MAG: amino-acid N-acetyltransferase [Gammaproteobacteria bacterium]|nr:amino-acid N-acetyltransferase [Gammaproteobacteria bacterium]MDH5593670.1 amino-acid N-acetyltransferase [Gammaproteobacteria bacterium]